MTRSVKFANLILAGGIIICIALLLYFFSISDSRLPSTLYKYYFFSATVLIVLVVLLRTGREAIKVKVALLFLSAGISIYAMELLLLVYNLVLMPAINKELPADFPDKFQIMTDLRKNGADAYPHVFPSDYIKTDGLYYNDMKVFPLGAISNSATVFCNEEGTPVIYDTDEHGFRNPRGQYSSGGFDIALIGDSFTQGFCVKNGEDIAGRMREHNWKVLNLGMEGSGPLIELGLFREYATPYKPKLVIWLYFEGNDMLNLGWEKTPTLIKYLDRNFSQDLVGNQKLADNALIAYVENAIKSMEEADRDKNNYESEKSGSYNMEFGSKIIDILKFQNLRMRSGLHGNCTFDTDPQFKNILTMVKGTVEEWGGKLYFVYLPTNERYMNNLCTRRWLHTQREKLVSLVNNLNIPVIDMTTHFDFQSDPLSLFLGHYNSRGYKLVAETIEKRINADLN